MFQYKIIIVFCCIFTIAQSKVVPDERCHFVDHECQINMYQHFLRQTADGIPSMGIPRGDPMHMSNLVASLPNSFKLTVVEGTVTGLKTCVVDDVIMHQEQPFRVSLNMTCKIKVNGTDKVEVPKSLMQELGGENITDDVFSLIIKATLTVEKYHVYVNVPFDLKWEKDEIYPKVYPLDIDHDLASAKFAVEDLDEGRKVNGQIIGNYIQEKVIELDLMSPITKKFGEFLQATIQGLVVNPARYFFKDDFQVKTDQK